MIQLLRIQIDALRTLCIQDYTPEQIEALIERNIRYASRGGSQGEITLVAEVKGVIVGLAALLGRCVSAVYVHPQFVRQGIGTHLLAALEQIATTYQIKTLRVAASLTAQPFYQANDYQVLGESDLITEKGLQIRYVEMKKALFLA
ncbi:MAG: GNAT family N-acetyltransferase [Leptolyngbyaceae cyanobacterium RM1_1_2]|nr:GNAT family N-acetyltransferase [Leptolyngbyaceae cyanobacterium RM1_1_2]